MSLPEKTLFGARPNSFFGEKADFCRQIVGRINLFANSQQLGNKLDPTGDPVAVLKQYSKGELLRLATQAGLYLDDLVPLDGIAPKEIESFAQRRQDSGTKIASVGELPDASQIAQIVLQMAVLEEICCLPPEWSEEKKVFMNGLREKYRKMLQT